LLYLRMVIYKGGLPGGEEKVSIDAPVGIRTRVASFQLAVKRTRCVEVQTAGSQDIRYPTGAGLLEKDRFYKLYPLICFEGESG